MKLKIIAISTWVHVIVGFTKEMELWECSENINNVHSQYVFETSKVEFVHISGENNSFTQISLRLSPITKGSEVETL